MSHDKIKAAARRRMAATGEPYAAARREAISEHTAAQYTSAVSADDIRAAAAAHRVLGPEFSDAVVASFIERVDRAIAARVEARLAGRAVSSRTQPTRRGNRRLTRRLARDVLAGGAGALVVVGAVELHTIMTAHSEPAASRLAEGGCASRPVGRPIPCFVPPRLTGLVQVTTRVDGKLTITTFTVIPNR